MPWKERSIVEERMRFVLRLKDGESMSAKSVHDDDTLPRATLLLEIHTSRCKQVRRWCCK